jgi:hypothetical protein
MLMIALLSEQNKQFIFCLTIGTEKLIYDCLTIGTEEAIEEVINALKGYNFGLKVEGNLTDNISCKIAQERDKGKV